MFVLLSLPCKTFTHLGGIHALRFLNAKIIQLKDFELKTNRLYTSSLKASKQKLHYHKLSMPKYEKNQDT